MAKIGELTRLSNETTKAKQATQKACTAVEGATAMAVAVGVAAEMKTSTATNRRGEPRKDLLPNTTGATTGPAQVNGTAATGHGTPGSLGVPFVSDSERPVIDATADASKKKSRRTSAIEGVGTRRRSSDGCREVGGVVMTQELSQPRSMPVLHPVFKKREQAAKELVPSTVETVAETAAKAGALAEKILACESILATAGTTAETISGEGNEGNDAASSNGNSAKLRIAEVTAAKEELKVLEERKAEAAEKLSGASLESTVAAMEVQSCLQVLLLFRRRMLSILTATINGEALSRQGSNL